jgi:hypothetical protein
MFNKIFIVAPLMLFSTNVVAETVDKPIDAKYFLIFIVAQILSIVGIITAGIKYTNRKKTKKNLDVKTIPQKTVLNPVSLNKKEEKPVTPVEKKSSIDDDYLSLISNVDLSPTPKISTAPIVDASNLSGGGKFSGGGATVDFDIDLDLDLDFDFDWD